MENKTNKTKVLFVITKSNFGGAQHYVYSLATALPHERFEVVVALGGQGLLTHKLRTAGVRIVELRSLERNVNPLRDVTSFFTLWKIFRDEQPDVVHLNSAKASGLGALAARLAGVPHIIFAAHGWAFNEERSLAQKLVIKFFSWLIIMLAHKTIAVSKAVKNDTKKWPFVHKKITVIKNGVAEPKFFTKEESLLKLFAQKNIPLPSNAFIVGTIAELHHNKGLVYAIEAFSKISVKYPDAYYAILGGGEEEADLTTLIESLGLHGRVFLLGFTEDAARFLPAFDIFLLSSITEGLALVILEAGLAELPVIATSVGGIPEVIEDQKTGLLVPSRNADALANAIDKLITSPTLRTSLGASLHEKVLHDFSLGYMVSETIKLYGNK